MSQEIRIFIATPAKRGSNKGNRITAQRWGSILKSLGHLVTVDEVFSEGSYDLLIALHARKSAKSVARFRSKVPHGRVIVALTGTDLNIDLGQSDLVDQSLELADRIVLLAPPGGQKLSNVFLHKSRVIFQSSSPLCNPPAKLIRFFEVSVLGHLRPVKDPFRTALAARSLPASSRVRVVHFGQALTKQMERIANREMERNRRYRWLGSVSHAEALRRLARSRLTVLSSESEGGSVVLSEAIANQVPILATRIDATVGMLGQLHPGLFEFEDTEALAKLINRAETDPDFYRNLVSAGERVKAKFLPRREYEDWNTLLKEI